LNIQLTPHEARVIGCLIEKEVTTPDQYPLSLNALTNACNQKSNRDPVMTLDERLVQDTVDGLVKKRLVSEKTGFGSRVIKYQHRFCNTDFGDLRFSEQELGIVCVLLLRGAQTPGELRTRSERFCRFGDVNQVEAVLEALMTRDDGPFVARLPREAGRRESRYRQLFCGEVPVSETAAAAAAPASDDDRFGRIEETIAELRREVDSIKSTLEKISSNP